MATLNYVQKARKANKEYGIKKGDSYYWWAFRYGGKHVSKTRPKPSQLINSEFLSSMTSFGEVLDDINSATDPIKTVDELKSYVESIVDDIRQLGEECQEKLDNMPEGLQQGSSGEILQNRIEESEAYALDLEGIDLDDYDGPAPEEGKPLPYVFTLWVEEKLRQQAQKEAELKKVKEEVGSAMELYVIGESKENKKR